MTLTHRPRISAAAEQQDRAALRPQQPRTTARLSLRTTAAGRRMAAVAAVAATVAAAAAALVAGLPPELGLLAGLAAWRLLRAPRSAAAQSA